MIVYFFLDFKGFIAEVLDWTDSSKMFSKIKRRLDVWERGGGKRNDSPVDGAKWQNFSLLSTKHCLFLSTVHVPVYVSIWQSICLFSFISIYLQSMYKGRITNEYIWT